jgi:hypothetical protein
VKPETDTKFVVPTDAVVWAVAAGLALPDSLVALLMRYLGSLTSPRHGLHRLHQGRQPGPELYHV